MDRILIRDLALRCVLGVSEEERREKQDVLLNLWVTADLAAAGRSDRFEDAVDYREIKKRILGMAEGSCFRLVEALAQAVADLVLEDPRVRSVRVRVEKPTALRFARSVGVEITRRRSA